MPTDTLQIRQLNLQDYNVVWRAMQDFTTHRNQDTTDELWVVEHPPVFTLGLNGKESHLRDVRDIPVIHSDRGGQVTYHGLGQLIVYVLIDLRRRNLGIRQLVDILELSVIDLLQSFHIYGKRQAHAPGVYVLSRKIASIGLRVRRGCSYHGLSLNVAMDLSPFYRINPCGYPGMEVIDLRSLGVTVSLAAIWPLFFRYLKQRLECLV